MVQVIKPSQVKVQTQQGEVVVSIILELNINLTAEGLNVSTRATAAEAVAPEQQKGDKVEWAIPDFGNTKIKFGKYREDE